MGDARPSGDGDWGSLGRAWTDLGLGDLLVVEAGAGLLEIRIAPPPSLPAAEETISAVLTSLLTRLAGEPVAVSPGPKAGVATEGALRFLVGAPRLIARIGAGYESGLDIADLMEGAWT